MIYLLDVAKIVTIPLIPKALGLPRAICYLGLHFGPCKIRYSEEKNKQACFVFLSFFRNFAAEILNKETQTSNNETND